MNSATPFFFGFMTALVLLIVFGGTPKAINEQWEKKLVEKGLGEYVIENINNNPTITFKFKEK